MVCPVTVEPWVVCPVVVVPWIVVVEPPVVVVVCVVPVVCWSGQRPVVCARASPAGRASVSAADRGRTTRADRNTFIKASFSRCGEGDASSSLRATSTRNGQRCIRETGPGEVRSEGGRRGRWGPRAGLMKKTVTGRETARGFCRDEGIAGGEAARG